MNRGPSLWSAPCCTRQGGTDAAVDATHGSALRFTAYAGFGPVAAAVLVAMGNTLPTTRLGFVRTAHTTLRAPRGS
ncbi:hypothetical protein [Streptomyces sp. NRRL B-24484]|uniref:hypothetical protein n=1 Tax=Streptomyces sp. NRRL B-24484 TaxID=1463833 RepID=UPI000B12C5ED|nr:hypothetical protein [Streptomyces sp. NRRL B-24484]